MLQSKERAQNHTQDSPGPFVCGALGMLVVEWLACSGASGCLRCGGILRGLGPFCCSELFSVAWSRKPTSLSTAFKAPPSHSDCGAPGSNPAPPPGESGERMYLFCGMGGVQVFACNWKPDLDSKGCLLLEGPVPPACELG